MQIVDINGNLRECLDLKTEDSYPGFIKVTYQSKIRKNFQYDEWYPIDLFLKNNPQYKNLYGKKTSLPEEDLGRVSQASSLTLTDKTKKWFSNQFVNYPLWISRGKGEGQIRKIVSNSSDTLIIDKPWDITPNKTSQYVISFNVHNPPPLGNTLPENYKNPKINKKVKKNKKI